ncbi:MAG: acetoacetate--CoA ligase [Desulfobacteraceae bacterium]|nr:MAG: acetoacetate--CoA ligase [Desulfobacteraceae bacterium]
MTEYLWKPSEERIQQTNMFHFMNTVNQKYGKTFTEYTALYEWSVSNIVEFWETFWEYSDILVSRSYSRVLDNPQKMPGAKWFEGAKLNFAENLLRYRDNQIALIFQSEGQSVTRLTYAELFKEVARVAMALKEYGVEVGDRVAGFMPNRPETIIAMLAATSIGATWSSCSPDFGIKGVLDRFGQIRPKVLFTADGYFFKGKKIDSLNNISKIIDQLTCVEKVIVVPFISSKPDISGLPKGVHFMDIGMDTDEIAFQQLPFDHPLYIMYSSGTTGLPKCMVQSAGGILLHQLKELRLHTDLKRKDTIFYFTTCGWMMWNWLTASLAVGATLVLYDGNPFYPDPEVLWRMVQDLRISIFGTSAGYLGALKNTGAKPGKNFNLDALRTVLSTGSPLSVEGFHYVYEDIKQDVQLSSISGGTDLNGCFALGNPMGPVYAGELQCRGLAMKVQAFDDEGRSVLNRQGELVCSAPFPSMPIYFWDDPEGKKYHSAYFDVYPNIWRHGDYIEINERGGVVITGRSDATLNPGGVRIGTAEIYRQVELIEEIQDSIVIGQRWKNDVRIVLFVKLQPGRTLDDPLINRIRETIRKNASPRHVPSKIISVPDIPYTLNMKKVELAVKKTIENKPVTNKDALLNPDVLKYYEGLKELQEE